MVVTGTSTEAAEGSLRGVTDKDMDESLDTDNMYGPGSEDEDDDSVSDDEEFQDSQDRRIGVNSLVDDTNNESINTSADSSLLTLATSTLSVLSRNSPPETSKSPTTKTVHELTDKITVTKGEIKDL